MPLRPFWAANSWHQWPPGSPSRIYVTSPWKSPERLACVGIGLLSSQSLFAPLSGAFSFGIPIGYRGGRDVLTSGPPSSLLCRTTSICLHLGCGTLLGMCPLVRVRTSVSWTKLPDASHCSLGWVSGFQLCLSAYSHDAYCIHQPPTQPLLPSLLWRFVLSCSPPRWILALVLCLLCGPLLVDSLGDLLPHFLGCQCVLGPSGFLSLCRLCGESLHTG